MMQPAPDRAVSLMTIEGGLTLIVVATALLRPEVGSGLFARAEHAFGSLARKKSLSVAVVGASAFLLRLVILPWCPIPGPFVNDDFSFLLAANTFASGRLTNPTPVMWQHFESLQITMKPTYMSMYFPAPGIVMAAGKVLTGNSWFGILLSTALMCAAICWMLQAWLPSRWALLGGMVAVLHLGLFSYWINTYTGGGSIAALGGALVLGALPRFMKSLRLRDSLLMAAGIVLLATSRPYEGILLCLPVAFVLGRWIVSGGKRPTYRLLLRRTAFPLALIVLAGAGMGYYNYRLFGSPLTPPYKINRATYAIVPYFVWQAPHPEPVYRHKAMRDFYVHDELAIFKELQTIPGFLSETLFFKPLRVIIFFAGIALLPPLIMLDRVLTDRRIRFLVVCCLFLAVGMVAEIFLIVHYVSPFTAAFYAIGLQAMRHLRFWRPSGQPAGKALTRLLVTLCVLLAGLRLEAKKLHLTLPEGQSFAWTYQWYGPGQTGSRRANIQLRLERLPGKQLAVVRYSPDHDPAGEWISNEPDIDHSKVIWAREMDAAENCELINYYKDRKVWLVQPDLQPASVTPYPTQCQTNSAPAGNHRMRSSAVIARANEVKP